MKDQFKTLLDCIRNIKIKLKRNDFRVAPNLFEPPSENIVIFNGFISDLEYRNFLYSKFKKLSDRIDCEVHNSNNDKKIVFREIKLLHYETLEFELFHFMDNNLLNLEIENTFEEKIIADEFCINKIKTFIFHQRQIIQLIKKHLEHRCKYLKKFFLDPIVLHCTNSRCKTENNSPSISQDSNYKNNGGERAFSIRWSKDKIQLLELLSALYDSDSVRTTTGEKLPKKHFFNTMFSVFNTEVKNVNSLLNSIKRRKSKNDSYISELLKVYNENIEL